MKIFGKHIFRSIKKEPLQPIMIVVIVTLCVAVMILSVCLPLNIYRNERASMRVDDWTSDIIIGMKASSAQRLLFEEEINAVLGDKGRAVGEFSLTGFSELTDSHDKTKSVQIQLGAFDLVSMDAFFEPRYIEYGKFTNTNITRAAIIDEPFAKEYGISLGDAVKINILGHEFEYTVEAIAKETGIFNREDILVDISSVRRVLAERSSLIASLSSEFAPYTQIHVKTSDGIDPETLKAELELCEELSDKRFELYSNNAKTDFYTTILTITILIPGILLLVVAAMMMISTFELLQKKRQSDIALFKTVGADSSHLNAMLYLESLIYGGVGGVLGCILTIPLIFGLNALYGFKNSKMSFGIFEILLGLGSSVLFTVVCTFMHIRKQQKKSLHSALASGNLDTDRRLSSKKLLCAIPAIVLFVVLSFLPTTKKYMVACLLLFAVVVFIYVISPYIIGCVAAMISCVLDKKRRGAGDFIIAAKSCSNSYPLRHAGRIMTLLVTIFVSLTFVLSSVNDQLESYVNFSSFDYIGMNVDEDTQEMIKNTEGVVGTARSIINRNVFFNDSTGTTGVSVKGDCDMCFDGDMLPSVLPVGNQLILSKGVAAMLELEVGDSVECTIADIPCTLELVDIINVRGDFAFYDSDYVGNNRDMFCVLTDGTDEAIQNVIAVFDERGIECLSSDEFFAQTYERINPQLVVFNVMFYIMILMTLVGIFNILGEQRMARMREFEIIKQNGRTDAGIVAMQAIEISYLLISAIICSVVFSFVICSIINVAATSFGMTLY